MNPLTTDFVTPAEAALIRADAAALVADVHLRTLVTYKKAGTPVFIPSTGAETNSYTDYIIGGVRSIVTEREAALSDGRYQAGDVRYTFERASLPITPGDEDLILEGSTTYKVKTWNTDPLSVLWNIVAGRVS
jgi:hypothetical protein